MRPKGRIQVAKYECLKLISSNSIGLTLDGQWHSRHATLRRFEVAYPCVRNLVISNRCDQAVPIQLVPFGRGDVAVEVSSSPRMSTA